MIKIGITDCGEKYPIYERWILSQNMAGFSQIETIRLGYKFDNFEQIKQCDGIVLTGGEDIHPKYYGQPEAINLCNPDFMDDRRDEFEWKICEYIFANSVPVLGICRGLQLVNVFLGGTLIPDIPTAGLGEHTKYYEGKDRYHGVEILHDSELSKITNIVFGEINSAHHQSAKLIAKSLKINALSSDGVVEGLEWASLPSATLPSASLGQRGHYLMLVQWHPERLINAEYNYFSYKIRQHFIRHIEAESQL